MIHAPADENSHQGYHSMLLSACEEYRAKLDKLEAENAALREKFATIPDEVWSKADLVEQIHQALAERDDADRKNAALREDKERLDWIIGKAPYLFFKALRSDLAKGRDQIDAARKETQPIRADHIGDINEMT